MYVEVGGVCVSMWKQVGVDVCVWMFVVGSVDVCVEVGVCGFSKVPLCLYSSPFNLLFL